MTDLHTELNDAREQVESRMARGIVAPTEMPADGLIWLAWVMQRVGVLSARAQVVHELEVEDITDSAEWRNLRRCILDAMAVLSFWLEAVDDERTTTRDVAEIHALMGKLLSSGTTTMDQLNELSIRKPIDIEEATRSGLLSYPNNDPKRESDHA